MANMNCYAARGLNILLGLFSIFIAMVLVVAGVSFLPVLGFLLAVILLGLSLRFFFAPRDETCSLER